MSDETPTSTPVKPGWKTTEFWIMLIVTIAGLLPTAGLFPSDSQIVKVCGLIVSAATAIGWTYKRTDLKKSAQLLMFVLLPLGLLGGCHTGEIRADAIHGSVQIICDRHDAMIDGKLDPKTISEADKATYKRSTELLRKVVNEARQ